MPEEEPAKGGSDGGDDFKAPASQAEFDRMVADRINRERSKFSDYDDLKAKAAKFDEAEDRSKSELQRITEERDAAVRERDVLTATHLKLDVGSAKGLTPAQAKRLVGSTKEELEADADAFLSDIGGTKKPPPDPKKLRSGSSTKEPDGLEGKDRAAALLRQYRTGAH